MGFTTRKLGLPLRRAARAMLSRPGLFSDRSRLERTRSCGLLARPALALDGLWVRSRRGWNMTDLLPELRSCTNSGQPFEQFKSI